MLRALRLSMWAVCLSCVVSAAVAQEPEKVPVGKLPKPVVEAIKKKFADGKLTEAHKEEADGDVTYDVAVTSKGSKYHVTVSSDGDIIQTNREVNVKELPKAVTEAVKKKHAKGKIDHAEEMTLEDEDMVYELIVVVDKQLRRVVADPKGKIIDDQELKE
jgi:hypothetical protein